MYVCMYVCMYAIYACISTKISKGWQNSYCWFSLLTNYGELLVTMVGCYPEAQEARQYA